MSIKGLASSLAEYLESEHGLTSVSVTELMEINTGWETELFTFKLNCDDSQSIDERDLVIRIFSGEHAASKAFKEYALMKRLLEIGYPVPVVYIVDKEGKAFGKPFILMQRIMGQTLDEYYSSDDQETLRDGLTNLCSLFVRLHSLDVEPIRELGVIPEITVEKYLDGFEKTSRSIAPWLEPLITWLRDNKPADSSVTALCHNDYHGFNIMLAHEKTPSVIDWSAARISDPRMDLGWSLMLYNSFGGDQMASMLLDAYSEFGGFVDDVDYFVALAILRRLVDLASVLYGDGLKGLKPETLDLMIKEKAHYLAVKDLMLSYTGIQLPHLDRILAEF